jgi:hypothetical protein
MHHMHRRAVTALLTLMLAVTLGATAPPSTAMNSTASGATECVPVTQQDLRYDATTLDSGNADTGCFQLPDLPAGTALWVGTPADPYVAGSEIRNAAGDVLCRRGACVLTDDGPFTYWPRQTNGPGRKGLFRLSPGQGCPAAPLATFGSSTHTLAETIGSGDVRCSEVPLHSGPYRGTATGEWTLVDETGATVCGSYPGHLEACFVSPELDATTAILLSRPHFDEFGEGNEPVEVEVAVDLYELHGAGCAPYTVAWTTPKVVHALADGGSVHCLALDSKEGERVAAGVQTSGYDVRATLEIVADDGTTVCPRGPDEDETYGCLLVGPAPYRVLSSARAAAGTGAGAYGVSVRPFVDASCPQLALGRWGAKPTQGGTASSCRRITLTQGQRVEVRGASPGEDPDDRRYAAVYGEDDGLPRCEAIEEARCVLTKPGDYVVVADPLTTDSLITAIDLRSTAGCVRAPASGLSGRRASIAAGQRECLLLPRTTPSFHLMHKMRVDDASYGTQELWIQVLDPDGEIACQGLGYGGIASCSAGRDLRIVLRGTPASYRMGWVPTSFAGPGCASLPGGARLRTRVTFSTDTLARCLRVPKRASGAEALHLTRAAGAGWVATSCLPRLGENPANFYARDDQDLICDPGPRKPYTVLMVGDGRAASHDVSRAGYRGRIVNFAAPRVLGTLRAGATLRVSPGAWGPWYDQNPKYTWRLDGRALSRHGYTLRVPSSWRGRTVSVTVTATSRHAKYASATSAGRRIARG